jgi:hypothetical protein
MKARRKKRNVNKINLFDRQWERHFSELQKFKKKYGHCIVSRFKNPELAKWCYALRFQYNRKTKNLTRKRIARLTQLGYVWENVYDLRWEQHLIWLKEYKEKQGHCNVPYTKDNKSPLYSLARWVRRQREYHQSKSNYLTAERIARLNSIGFCWINPSKRGAGKKRINDNDLLDELRRLYLLCGKPPSETYIDGHGKYVGITYINHFGSIPKARIAAGITAPIVKKRISDVQLLDELKRLTALLDRTPAYRDIIKYGKYSMASYLRCFGSIVKARKAAGISSPVVLNRQKRYSDEQMLDDLKRLAVLNGRTPTLNDIERHGKYSVDLYYDRFGNLTKAREAAGLGAVVNT